MDSKEHPQHDDQTKVSPKSSPVKALISWLVKADREYRVAQKMLNDTHKKL